MYGMLTHKYFRPISNTVIITVIFGMCLLIPIVTIFSFLYALWYFYVRHDNVCEDMRYSPHKTEYNVNIEIKSLYLITVCCSGRRTVNTL
jgi:uncharacterized membrane protein